MKIANNPVKHVCEVQTNQYQHAIPDVSDFHKYARQMNVVYRKTTG